MKTCPVAADYTKDNFLLKNDFLVFSRYNGNILQVRWTKAKAKLLASNFFRILCTGKRAVKRVCVCVCVCVP